jgi:heptosyltransferase II
VGALFALIQRVDLVIAGDSGPIHIAAATETPAVAIFGPTDPRIWAPHSSQLTVLRKSECPPCGNPYCCSREPCFACTTGVTTADVIEACRRVLLKSSFYGP